MMKTLRRWTTSIVTSIDQMISQVENHEALVNVAIGEVQEASARARVQLKRVEQDGQRMRKRLVELHEGSELWRDRAVKAAGVDEKRALECLKRKKKIEREIASLEEQEREHVRMEKQLCVDLKTVEDRLQQLKSQRNLLRTRQSRAEALGALGGEDTSIISEIDEIFDRWEIKVSQYEVHGESAYKREDEFEQQFVSEEEEEELKIALVELLQNDAKQRGSETPHNND